MADYITRAQIAKIWVAAHDLGLDRETLYLLVPRGSISSLTRREASDLIEHLCGPGPQQRPTPGTRRTISRCSSHLTRGSAGVTAEQRRFISVLFSQLGWREQAHRSRGFLRKFAHVNSVAELRDRKRAIALIEALKAMVKRRRQKQIRLN